MTRKNEGGQAFPGKVSPDIETIKLLREATNLGLMDASRLLQYSGGMTVRTYIATAALQAYAPFFLKEYGWHPDQIALYSAQLADALIAELSK